MKQQACKLWLAGIINTKIRLLEHFQTLNIYELYADSSDAGISATDFAVWRMLALIIWGTRRVRRFNSCDNPLC